MSKKNNLESIRQQAIGFIDEHKTVILSTIKEGLEPDASYAAFLYDNHKFYILVSEFSAHTGNLMHNKYCSLLFMEPEEQAKHIFARKRLTIKSEALEIYKNVDKWQAVIEKLEAKFGGIITTLKQLEDFHLFEISTISANYVTGFANAYKIDGKNLFSIKHLNDVGHKKADKQSTHNKRPLVARESAKKMGISEAEYVSISAGNQQIQSLDSEKTADILADIQSLGEVMALTRNEGVVLEHNGIYENCETKDEYVVFNSSNINLRLRFTNIKFIFAVNENGRSSLQFFDKFGEAAHKVYVNDKSNKNAYQNLLDKYQQPNAKTPIEVENKESILIKGINESNKKQIIKEFKAIDDVHKIKFLPKQHQTTIVNIYEIIDDVIKLDNTILESFLKKASNSQLPLMMFASNNSVTQIHNNTIDKIVKTGSWINVLDPTFNLHANLDLISYSFLVVKYYDNTPTYSLELFDKEHTALLLVHLDKTSEDYKKWCAIFLDILELER